MSNKVSGKRQKGADSPELREKDARSMAGIMGVFAVAVLGIFPLAYDNYYYNILETKYHFYCVASIAAMALMLFYGIFSGRIAGFCGLGHAGVLGSQCHFLDPLRGLALGCLLGDLRPV